MLNQEQQAVCRCFTCIDKSVRTKLRGGYVALSLACFTASAAEHEEFIKKQSRGYCNQTSDISLNIVRARNLGLTKAAVAEMMGTQSGEQEFSDAANRVNKMTLNAVFDLKLNMAGAMSFYLIECVKVFSEAGRVRIARIQSENSVSVSN